MKRIEQPFNHASKSHGTVTVLHFLLSPEFCTFDLCWGDTSQHTTQPTCVADRTAELTNVWIKWHNLLWSKLKVANTNETVRQCNTMVTPDLEFACLILKRGPMSLVYASIYRHLFTSHDNTNFSLTHTQTHTISMCLTWLSRSLLATVSITVQIFEII